MLRFDPKLKEQLAWQVGCQTMLMKSKSYKRYCYINPQGYKDKCDFEDL
jgi:hypothetical protein